MTRPYVLAFCDGGYTSKLPVKDVAGGQAWVAFGYNGRRLESEHGGPAHLLVPHLYFSKSAKSVRGLELLRSRRTRFLETSATASTETHGGNSGTRRLTWQVATVDLGDEGNGFSPHDRAGRVGLAGAPGGAHLDVRLTAEDGYMPERSYSSLRGRRRAGRDHGGTAG